MVAPTGSGKTLSAFLWALDSFVRHTRDETPDPARAPAPGQAPAPAHAQAPGQDQAPAQAPAPTAGEATPSSTARQRQKRATRVLYISPLKALGVDVERNLRSPLIGITQTAARLGLPAPEIRVGVRSGDTPAGERRKLQTNPPDILITTPESLFLMLTSRARETLGAVDTVIVDEVHAVAGTKRGAHLAVSLERLDALLRRPAQRIGLSATVEPREEVARFLGGTRPVTVVAPESTKKWDLTVTVPVEDMTDLPAAAAAHDQGPASGLQPQASIWPHVEERIVDLIEANRSTIVFANSRRLAERLTGRLNEIHEERLQLAAEQAAEQAAQQAARPAAPAGAPSGSDADACTDADPDGGWASAWEGLREGAAARSDPTRTPAEMMAQAGQTSGAPAVLARAHHGSVSKDQRAEIEDALKSGRLRCVVATSSLELGIDMGLVDLVVQVESPNSVASGLQRVGRAGHQVGAESRGVFFPKHRGDLLDTTVTVERMVRGAIEPLKIPQNPLDILAQQTVAAAALGEVDVEEWYDVVRRSAPFAALPRSAYEATLDLLAGKYPSDEFAELRPRVVWDRDAGTLEGRPGAQRLAVTSGGTIPDRGLFGVFLAGDESGAKRVGELDEEMVYESRVGDVFALGATSWRIEDITHDRVIVTPAYGQPGKLPFWHGDGPGRPVELGYAVGRARRELAALGEDDAVARLSAAGLDPWAVSNVRAYLEAQREATGSIPSDQTLVVERFQDELGDWRVVLHSPFGMPVHAPWALAVGARLRERYGLDGAAMASDDGIVLRVPLMEDEPPGADLFLFDPEELDDIVTREVGGSALFASRFRECAARALLLPRQNPGQRTPLWQQRQRSAQLLDVAKKYPTFPIILETARECLQDVYDVPALRDVAAAVGRREIRIAETTTRQPSPFAQSLLFGYVAQFLYEGDSPLAERRAAALSLDPTLLNDLLGRSELRELLDPDVIRRTEAELQRTAPDRRLRGVEGAADLLRLLGPLTAEELALRLRPDGEATDTEPAGGAPSTESTDDAGADDAGAEDASPDGEGVDDGGHASVATARAWAEELVRSVRALRVNVAGREVFAAIEDAARLRDALGVPLPIGVPLAFVEPVEDPLGDLVGRYARTHGPFASAEAAGRLGLGVAVVHSTLQRLAQSGRVLDGEFRPRELLPAEHRGGDAGLEWCDAEVLRRIRRRSLAALRAEVEPVDAATYARFLPAWQFVGDGETAAPQLRGADGVAAVVEQLAGYPAPASAWETHILPARVADYRPGLLDELLSSGEVLLTGAGALSGNDGWVALHPAGTAELTVNGAPGPAPAPQTAPRTAPRADRPGTSEADESGEAAEVGEAAEAPSAARDAVLSTLSTGGAYFFRHLAEAHPGVPQPDLLDALWELFWAGRLTNDTFAPVRGLLDGGRTAHKARASTPRSRLARPSRLGLRSGLRGRLEGGSSAGLRTGLRTGAGGPDGGDAQAVTTGVLTPAQQARAAGRWSLAPAPEPDATLRAHATAELLLDRYGVLTRGPVASEEVPGGFALLYRVLARLEEAGHIRRGYFIEHLGAAQFALSATVDRLRAHVGSGGRAGLGDDVTGPDALQYSAEAARRAPLAVALAATDPANPYGAALGWPAAPSFAGEDAPRHRPGRKAGAVVVLVNGALALYVERGGRTVLAWTEDPAELAAAAEALVRGLRAARVEKISVEKVSGVPVLGTPLAQALRAAGFYAAPNGVRFRA
ncbi:ATP-dependent helicase [Zhihengliuella alba]|uniref:ATP-dependent helicase n=1 Tax=Zhihengliuella alba TaxID=547018 RepID=A0ABP7E0B9_9MICC